MGKGFEGGGNDGNDDDGKKNVSAFPTRAARWRDSAGFYRRRPEATAIPTASDEHVPAAVEPLTEEECVQIAGEINEDLTPLALSHPRWNITEQKIRAKVVLHIRDANNQPAPLMRYFKEAGTRDISQKEEDLLLYLSAARAYLYLIQARDGGQTEEFPPFEVGD
jgi:hypothetical protein